MRWPVVLLGALIVVACAGPSSPASLSVPTQAVAQPTGAPPTALADVSIAPAERPEDDPLSTAETCLDSQGRERPAGHWMCRSIAGRPPADSGGAASAPKPVNTPDPVRARAASAEAVDPRRLAADPNAYRGKNLVPECRALTVQQQADFTWVHLDADVYGVRATEHVIVRVRPKNSDILRGNCYEVHGVGAGTETATRALTGVAATMPLVESYAIRPGRSDSRQTFCGPPAS
jgi:hypothetical protein